MWKLYQNSWHGVDFNTFAKVTSSEMAGVEFYTEFYKKFFDTHKSWDDLESEWVELKKQSAEFLIKKYQLAGGDEILSVGCGFGIIEKLLIERGIKLIEVTEVSDAPLKWIKELVPEERVHAGFFPDCIPAEKRYKLILFASADYFFTQRELIKILSDAKDRLQPDGAVCLLSWSFAPDGLLHNIRFGARAFAKWVLEVAGVRHRGQYWGYLRNALEYRGAVEDSGLHDIQSGLFEKRTRWETFWIDGKR